MFMRVREVHAGTNVCNRAGTGFTFIRAGYVKKDERRKRLYGKHVQSLPVVFLYATERVKERKIWIDIFPPTSKGLPSLSASSPALCLLIHILLKTRTVALSVCIFRFSYRLD